MMIKEKDLATQFEPSFHQLISDVELQNTLRLNMKKLAKTDAAERIVDAIEKLVNL